MPMHSVKRWLLPASLAAFALFVVFAWLAPATTSIPDSLATLQLVSTTDGDQARAIINRLHDKNVTPEANVIGEYSGDKAGATLYVSVYRSASDASEAMTQMAERIRAGNSVFGHYREVDVRGRNISMCIGMGQAHFFFPQEKRLFWLAVDFHATDEVLQSLLRWASL